MISSITWFITDFIHEPALVLGYAFLGIPFGLLAIFVLYIALMLIISPLKIIAILIAVKKARYGVYGIAYNGKKPEEPKFILILKSVYQDHFFSFTFNQRCNSWLMLEYRLFYWNLKNLFANVVDEEEEDDGE